MWFSSNHLVKCKFLDDFLRGLLNILSVKAFYLLEMRLVQAKKIFFWTKTFYLVEIDYTWWLGGITKIYRKSKALINMRLSSGEGSCAGTVLPQWVGVHVSTDWLGCSYEVYFTNPAQLYKRCKAANPRTCFLILDTRIWRPEKDEIQSPITGRLSAMPRTEPWLDWNLAEGNISGQKFQIGCRSPRTPGPVPSL